MIEKTKKAIIFGTARFGEVVDFYLTQDSEYEVAAFTASGDNILDSFCDKPVVSFEDVQEKYPPTEYDMFVAIGARKMNLLRQGFCQDARDKGYTLLSYICSKAICWERDKIGDNVFIFENNVIQPFVSIGNGTILWSGNHIGHHSTIGDYCFITSHVVISGDCIIKDRCFVGVNATFHDGLTIGEANLIGAGALIQKDTDNNAVYLEKQTEKFGKDSGSFFK
jgi:sugar O-acyltransferase (sialic acid O-acetyltransferase NeuD family)